MLGFQLFHLRLHALHVGHRSILLAGQREEDQLHDDGRPKDRNTEIADVTEEEVHQLEHRFGDEVEPAPVDKEVEMRDLVFFGIAVDERNALGACENHVLQLSRLAGLNGQRIALVVSLVARLAIGEVGESAFIRQCLRRYDRRGPVFVGNAKPAAGCLGARDCIFFDVGIGMLAQAAVGTENAEEALMNDPYGRRDRLVVTGDAAIGRERYGFRARVLDLVRYGDHVMIIDRNRPVEHDALVVGEGKRHRCGRGQLLAAGECPFRAGTRRLSARVAADVADFAEIAFLGIGGREQRDDRARVIDGLVILAQLQVVEARAGQVDRAGNGRSVDFDSL
ncbi:hypothetical protein D3C87_1266350 [compost metagenome]